VPAIEKPRLGVVADGVLALDRRLNYLRLRLEALSGLIFICAEDAALETWVAMLQLPFFHFKEGSGHAVQNHPLATSVFRLQPLQFSTISWQNPPL
jgi:hypothetical protein